MRVTSELLSVLSRVFIPHGLFIGTCINIYQEPGTNEEIKKFATEKYGAKFDMFAKIDVNKSDAHPLWEYLKIKQKGTLGK